jgi:hypothetical protein
VATSLIVGGFGTAALVVPVSARAAASSAPPAPALVALGAGRLDLFTRDDVSGAITMTSRRANAWGAPSSLGGAFATGPSATRFRGGIAVVAVTAARRVSLRTSTSGRWSNWSDLGGDAAGPAALASSANGVLEVFIRTPRNRLLVRRLSSGRWSPWTHVGLGITTSPAVVPIGTDAVAIVAGRAGGTLSQLEMRRGRAAPHWVAIPGAPRGLPALAVTPLTSVRTLLVRGTDGLLWSADYSPRTKTWSPGWKVRGVLGSAPAGAYATSTQLEVLAFDRARTLVRVGRVSGTWGIFNALLPLSVRGAAPVVTVPTTDTLAGPAKTVPTATTPPATDPATTPPPTTAPPTSAPPIPPPSGLGVTGRWSINGVNMPVRAAHAALLRDGRVLLTAGSGNDPVVFAANSFKAVIWNPANNTMSSPLDTPSDMFCSGNVTLPDGKVLIQGGTASYAGVPAGEAFRGLRTSYVFDPATNQYSKVNDTIEGHWYPTLTKIENGDVWAAGGYTDTPGGGPAWSTEMFDSAASKWKSPGPVASGGVPQAPMYWGTYPHVFLMQDGRMFYTGGHTFGDGMPGTGAAIYDWRSMTIGMIPGLRDKGLRDQAGSVLLPPAQNQTFLIAGGGSVDNGGNTNKVDIVNMNVPNPSYVPGPDLPGAGRLYLNLTTLPDRTVLASNGSAGARDSTGNVMAASIYNPATNAWAVIDPDPVGRNYHSTSLLLPDGRVAVFGSNPADDSWELRISVYEPPYMFRGTRPTVTSAPATAVNGQVISLGVTGNVATASLTSPSSPTHQTDTNVRLVDLPITGTGTSRTATVPANKALLPPGPYMLTVLDDQGVPSVAKWITVG